MQANRLRASMVYALLALGLAAANALPAQVLTTLYSFCTVSGGNCPDGENLYAGLVQGLDGNLYGTTYQGGTYGGGTVFKIGTSGSLTTLYNFCAVSGCADGQFPYAGLTLATNGSFFGTTQGGGTSSYGTVFSITPAGVLTTVYSFCSQSGCADGGYPYGGLFQATNGLFYGTTFVGGHTNGESPEGTVFRSRPAAPWLRCTNSATGSAPARTAPPRWPGSSRLAMGTFTGPPLQAGQKGAGPRDWGTTARPSNSRRAAR